MGGDGGWGGVVGGGARGRVREDKGHNSACTFLPYTVDYTTLDYAGTQVDAVFT